MKVVKHQHTLPRELVDAPSLEAFKFSLDVPLSNLTYLKMTLNMAGEVNKRTFKGPFQPKSFFRQAPGTRAISIQHPGQFSCSGRNRQPAPAMWTWEQTPVFTGQGTIHHSAHLRSPVPEITRNSVWPFTVVYLSTYLSNFQNGSPHSRTDCMDIGTCISFVGILFVSHLNFRKSYQVTQILSGKILKMT